MLSGIHSSSRWYWVLLFVDYMAREATWARDTGKVPNDAVLPEASVFIDSAPLIRVRPASVSLD